MSALRITFWGVRDARPAIGADFAHYGGDTSCIEIEADDARVAIDAGTGLRALVRERGAPSHIVLPQLSFDRVQGLPHIANDAEVTILASAGPDGTLSTLLSSPLRAFPGVTPLDYSAARLITAQTTLRAFWLDHGAVIVVQTPARKLCYLAQNAPLRADVANDLALVAHGANILIVNAAHSDANANPGGFTWQDAVRLKQESGAELLAITGHHPDCTDAELATIAGDAGARFPNVFFARTGCQLDL